jgi:hypothetical protein
MGTATEERRSPSRSHKPSTRPRIDWRSAIGYVAREPAWKLRVGIGGLLILLLPPVGWLLALGYRSIVGQRIVDRERPLLPSWTGLFGAALRRGSASSGVILAYLTPFVIAYWILGLSSFDALAAHRRELLIFAAAVMAFPPLALPGMPALYAARYDWLQFSAGETALLALLFFGPIVLLPSAFLQVAQQRRFSAAFHLGRVVRLVAAAPRLYLQAWLGALTVSAGAVAGAMDALLVVSGHQPPVSAGAGVCGSPGRISWGEPCRLASRTRRVRATEK